MTISGTLTRFLVEEHKYYPFPKEIHLLGRQTIQVSLEQTQQIFKAADVAPIDVIVDEFDTTTRQAISSSDVGVTPLMTDTIFFKMFGVESVRAIDHSDFEGADIVFDLTKKLPQKYASTADLIFDGSVMDNIFDPASAMHNVAELLRPGGRYIGVNIGTTKWLPSYVAFNPYWFFDFFIANGFRDVKVYVLDFADYNPNASWVDANVFLLDPNANHREVHNFPVSNGAVPLVIIAEKDNDSTSTERTSQGCYRLDEEWSLYDSNISKIIKSKRPVLQLQKRADKSYSPPGFMYVGQLDGFGLSTRNPHDIYPVLERGKISLGNSFAGDDWGAIESHNGSSWRWIDDNKEKSSVLLNLAPNQSYIVEAKIHTCRDIESINALRGYCDGIVIADQHIKSESGEYGLIMTIPDTITNGRHYPIHLGFAVERSAYATPTDGRREVAPEISAGG